MNIEALKLELIQWILLLQDIQLLNEIQNIKQNYGENSTAIQPQKFGCGQGIFTYVADDCDATPAGFSICNFKLKFEITFFPCLPDAGLSLR